MSITLLALSLGHERLWVTLPASQYFATVGMTFLSIAIIFGGAIIAFCMVVAEFALIANTSALTFMVAGTFKEIVTGGDGWWGGVGWVEVWWGEVLPVEKSAHLPCTPGHTLASDLPCSCCCSP